MKQNFFIFLFLVLLTFLFTFILNEVLDVDKLTLNVLLEQLTKSQIQEYLNFHKKWAWFKYLPVIVLLIVKIPLVTMILDIGLFFYEKKISFQKLFRIVIIAEFVFLIVIIFKIIWFLFFEKEINLDKINYFYPLSLITLTDYESLKPWFVYPLQVINFFEVIYWIVLAYLIDNALNVSKNQNVGLKIVVSSYGISLIIWIVAIMFLVLNMS